MAGFVRAVGLMHAVFAKSMRERHGLKAEEME